MRGYFNLFATLQAGPSFDILVNEAKLKEISETLKAGGEPSLVGDIGFPSSIWFSDHLPVGAIL